MYEFLSLNTFTQIQVDDEYDSWHFKGKDGFFITHSIMRAGLKHSAFVYKLFWDPFSYSHFDYLRTKLGQNILTCALKCRIKVFLRFPFASTGCSMPVVVAMALAKPKSCQMLGHGGCKQLHFLSVLRFGTIPQLQLWPLQLTWLRSSEHLNRL